jgi:hypothetical protein
VCAGPRANLTWARRALLLSGATYKGGHASSQVLETRDARGATPALCAAAEAYRRPARRTSLLHCVAACVQLGSPTPLAAESHDGRPLIALIAALGATDLLQQILLSARPGSTSALLEARCRRGLTPLAFATAHGMADCVRLLLAHGATAEAADGAGALPTDHALAGWAGVSPAGQGHAECHALLTRHLVR